MLKFAKLHGYGNDYLVIEASELNKFLPLTDDAARRDFVRRICQRHYGAGADGVALVEKIDGREADFRVRIFNPDGGEAAMSGNGTRCAAAYLYHAKRWRRAQLRFSTRAGIKLYALLASDGNKFRFAAEIGQPRFAADEIPMKTDKTLSRVVNYNLPLETGESVRITALEMCNPNVCVFVDDFERVEWRRLGALIEHHAQFPERTNVEFVRAINRKLIEARVWERGVGATLASGTGACAAAVASCVNDLTDREVTVKMPGGELQVVWRATDDEVILTGDAAVVYRGEWLS